MARTLLPVSAELTATVTRRPRSTLYPIVRILPLYSDTPVDVYRYDLLVYIVKDLVPDMTLFYKQYKSIQPWLQNDNPPEKGTSLVLSFLFNLISYKLRQASSSNHLKTAASSMACTNAFSVLVVRHLVHLIGGTRMNIWALRR